MRVFLIILLVIGLFSCNPSPESVAKKYFEVANQTVKGDANETIYLKNHLSKSAKIATDSLPFLLQYSLLTTTKNGQLVEINVLKKHQIKVDSIILEIELVYADKSKKQIKQVMVYENKEWKLGLSSKP